MKLRRGVAVGAALLVALTMAAACGKKSSSENTIVGKKSLKIGVKEDQPGIGFKGTGRQVRRLRHRDRQDGGEGTRRR